MSFEDLTIKQISAWIAGIVGVVLPVWGAIAYGYNFRTQLVMKEDIADMATQQLVQNKDLDARIERAEIKLLIYTSKDSLTPDEQISFDRIKAQLINLEAQRDEKIGAIQ